MNQVFQIVSEIFKNIYFSTEYFYFLKLLGCCSINVGGLFCWRSLSGKGAVKRGL